MSNFVKIRPVGAELFHAYKRTVAILRTLLKWFQVANINSKFNDGGKGVLLRANKKC
jgi:hypothetical protein